MSHRLNPHPVWEVHGEYGTHHVYEYSADDGSRCVYGQIRGMSKRLATEVANALNGAYARGKEQS